MPPNGVLGLGLGSGGKALAGDWGLLKAELSEVGKPCMLWVWDVAVPPRLREAMPDSGSICRSTRRVLRREPWMSIRCLFFYLVRRPWQRDKWRRSKNTCTGEMASKLLVLGARPFGITPGGGCLALFITLLQLATMVRIVSDSSWETLLQESSETQHGFGWWTPNQKESFVGMEW